MRIQGLELALALESISQLCAYEMKRVVLLRISCFGGNLFFDPITIHYLHTECSAKRTTHNLMTEAEQK